MVLCKVTSLISTAVAFPLLILFIRSIGAIKILCPLSSTPATTSLGAYKEALLLILTLCISVPSIDIYQNPSCDTNRHYHRPHAHGAAFRPERRADNYQGQSSNRCSGH